MDSKRALYYAAVAIGVLIAVSVVVSIVSAILSLAWAVVSAAVTLAVLVGIVYVAYKVGSWLSSGDDGTRSTDSVGGSRSSASVDVDDAADRQERLRRQYVEGEIDEAEFERRIARELETEDLDGIERELERER
ncbi:SHOCT domain-containing protein [Halorubrum rubrum]|uniref:SHOCT domain-containing protein n=1 Tax=Halorubrum rubrum TaxID=1126240 RepID=A0ABD5QY74_9EURY|nr:SHOCT domain-containing protein [Halorubrum rubrum]